MDVELARQQWQEGNRRLRPAQRAQVDVVLAELRARVGQTFTLAELVGAYDGADDWARELLDETFPEEVPHEPGTVTDAAFHAYARGASDYRP